MHTTKRLATATATAMAVAVAGLASASPAESQLKPTATTCAGQTAHVVGTGSADTITVLSDRVIVTQRGRQRISPIPPKLTSPLVIAALGGSDTINIDADIDVLLCTGTGKNDIVRSTSTRGTRHLVFAEGGVTATFGKSDDFLETTGTIWALDTGAGDDTLLLRQGGSAVGDIDMGGGDDIVIVVETRRINGSIIRTTTDGDPDDPRNDVTVSGDVNTGDGEDVVLAYDGVTFEGDIDTGDDDDTVRLNDNTTVNGELRGGNDDDRLALEDRATAGRIHGGDGDDTITTSDANDEIFTGPGTDTVDAGFGYDRCDGSQGATPGRGDSYENCERINIGG